MQSNEKPVCPECHESPDPIDVVDRRSFIRVLGGHAAALTALGAVPAARAAGEKKADRAARPAEEMILELYKGLSSEQKGAAVMPYDHAAAKGGTPTRLGMYNRPIGKSVGDLYTPAQQELAERILKAICSDEEGYQRISRNGKFDGSGSFQGIGAHIFGDPTDAKQPYAMLFTGHHLTVRCDGNFKDNVAWGGPMYYGHSAHGYSDRNVYYFQTKSVWSIFDALSAEQRKQATVKGSPGEQAPSVRFRAAGEAHPGLAFGTLPADQKQLVEKVMREILSPYRKEDADEVMNAIKAGGGLERLHLAFYNDGKENDKEPWHFWRLEGPGFVWNFRILPHVHCFVNIAGKA